MDTLRAKEIAPCKAAVYFSRPGRDHAGNAVVAFDLLTRAAERIRLGEAWAALKQSAKAWRVVRYEYDPLIGTAP